MGREMQMAIIWWKQALKIEIPHQRNLANKLGKVNLFCDAASTPPKVAAILFTEDGKPVFTRLDVDNKLKAKFEQRDDNDIMGLEILAIIVGVATFAKQLNNKYVKIWTDNTGGEAVLRQGAAKAMDHNALVHIFWLLAIEHDFMVEIARVPTDDNIADGPTRPGKDINCNILHALGATEDAPRLPSELNKAKRFVDIIS